MTPSAAEPEPVRAAVVLAGGASRRFGRDKLVADLDGMTLLDRVLDGLPDVDVIVVGPPRPVVRAVRFVREDPPGGGPAAAMVTGLRAALSGSSAARSGPSCAASGSPGAPAEIFWVLPGDTPDAGRAAIELDRALRSTPTAPAVVAVDGADRRQPLQLALRRTAVDQLILIAGPRGGQDASARRLVAGLDPAPLQQRVDATAHADIDTQQELAEWLAARGRSEGSG